MKASYIKSSLLKTIDSMNHNRNLFVRHPNVDFTRNRACPFHALFLFLISMEDHTLNRELRRFFPFKKNHATITKSALIQQRSKLNDDAFPFLFSSLNQSFAFKKSFKGYHLLACDGSDINVPPLHTDASTCVTSNTQGTVYHQMHLNSVYDILEERYTDILVQPRAQYDEREAFLSFLSRNPVPGKCLFIADRGYFSLNVLAHLLHSDALFLLRISGEDCSNSLLKRFSLPDTVTFDIDLHFSVTRSGQKIYKDHPAQFVYVRPDRPFDFIPPEDKESLFPISVRLVRFPLPTGEYEYLLTDLPRRTFPAETLKYLYRLRWGIETSYRHLKYNAALNSFHCVRRDFILQEIYARVILYNLTMLLVHSVSLPQRNRKYQYKISVSDAVGISRDFLIHRIKNETIEKDLQQFVTDIRPDRSFPRKDRSKRFVPLNYRS